MLKHVSLIILENLVDREFIIQAIGFTIILINISLTHWLGWHFFEGLWNQSFVLEPLVQLVFLRSY
jgi:hypothetical protein